MVSLRSMPTAHPIRTVQAAAGLFGPLPLSQPTRALLEQLIATASNAPSKRNLHSASELARAVISDATIRTSVRDLFGGGYQLWRTNFFQRAAGVAHPGVAWHHDKHFQDGDGAVDFNEVGDHISIVIALDQIDHRNGPFQYIPGSFSGAIAGYRRDTRPYHQRPPADHFPALPAALAAQAVVLPIPAGHFCLFHSALLHGSTPSNGAAARTSMVGRLARHHCHIPAALAAPHEVLNFC
jgi:ectoine hydroxylase-related dioxygenase (phytanoyl-CoA dioxygenase family)